MPIQILLRADEPAAEVINSQGKAAVCLVCEHASAAIPSSLGDLGLAEGDRHSHAVWDLGAADLARTVSAMLDATMVIAGVSRLVHDCNRPPERADAMPSRTETVEVPGNRDLADDERAVRVREVYEAFHRTLAETLDGFATPPALVTIHSFTPTWFGVPRTAEIGLLHDADDTLARRMLAAAGTSFRAELNVPYSAADGVTHTLARHATARGLSNVMVEVRNDLLATRPNEVAQELAAMLARALPNHEGAA